MWTENQIDWLALITFLCFSASTCPQCAGTVTYSATHSILSHWGLVEGPTPIRQKLRLSLKQDLAGWVGLRGGGGSEPHNSFTV